MFGFLAWRAARSAARTTSRIAQATGVDRPKEAIPWASIGSSAKVIFAALFVLSVVLIGGFVAIVNARY